ncbi:hypothetical protein M4D81_28615 [Paenibacillus sp. p3-SID867]|uniref:beta-xylosidase family glycoside hydrolase n=1 Tax=Paenibacillus sp. p3-SID867 TaxID=2916363 RepID=UPI0021A3BC3E|nr:hypothetical protein [Paenibacillus sp. p3-SID867]MCT1402962.1 hypothetical protein [Paenibacillus sp. p3-SID867]
MVFILYMCSSAARQRLCPLGRETELARVVWTEDGWLRLADGGKAPKLKFAAPNLSPHPAPELPGTDHFDACELSAQYFTLRVPANDEWLSLSERPGYLQLRGRESLYSWFNQSMVARRK